MYLNVPEAEGGERADGDVSGGVPEVATHVDASHNTRDGGEEDAQDGEPRVVLRVARRGVVGPGHPRPPRHAGL